MSAANTLARHLSGQRNDVDVAEQLHEVGRIIGMLACNRRS